MTFFRLIRLALHIGILNVILLLLAFFGITLTLLMAIPIYGPYNYYTPTISDIIDSKKEAISFETLTEKQLHEGTMTEGTILFNIGRFTTSTDERKKTKEHYAILLGDKVISIATYFTNPYLASEELSLSEQKQNYDSYLEQEGLSIWQYHEENNSTTKKKEKENKKTVKQVIQEHMESDPGIAFKGKIVKMDAATEDALRNYVTPDGENEPIFEIIPYEIQRLGPVDQEEMISKHKLIALSGIIGIAALSIFILRMRAHKHSP